MRTTTFTPVAASLLVLAACGGSSVTGTSNTPPQPTGTPVMSATVSVQNNFFDPATVRDRSTFAQPNQLAEGMRWVLVNGIPVIEDGQATGALPGQVLRGAGYRGE